MSSSDRDRPSLYLATGYFSLDGGSTGQLMHALVSNLDRLGCFGSLTVVASDENYQGRESAERNSELPGGMRVRRFSTLRRFLGAWVPKLISDLFFSLMVAIDLLRTKRPSVVVSISTPFSLPLAVGAVCRLRRLRHVYVLHDIYPDVAERLLATPWLRVAFGLIRRLQRITLGGAERNVVLGRCMSNHLVSEYGVPPRRVVTIPNWSLLEDSGLAKNRLLRDELGIDDRLLVLFGGNLGPAQDLSTAMRAIEMLHQRKTRAHFAFIGNGSHRQRWIEYAEGRRLANVSFMPATSNTRYSELISSADVGLVSLAQGLSGLAVPSKLYPHLAVGHAVLAACEPSSEVALVVQEAACGSVVEPGDVNGFVGAIEAWIASRDLLLQNQEAAKAVYQSRYSPESAADSFCATLREAAA